MASPNKRRLTDMGKLMMKDFKVDTFNDDMKMGEVYFHGPPNSLYKGGVWKIRVELPEDYPQEPPLIHFVNKIYHPNICEDTGTICVDVLKEKWNPEFDLIHVFEAFLPQLLLEPNPSDPLNEDAASLMNRNLTAYKQKVKEYCTAYAKPSNDDDASEEDGSGSDDNENAGKAEP